MTTLEARMEEAVLEAAQNEYGDDYVELHTYVYANEFDKPVINGKATVNTASRFTDNFAGMRIVMTNRDFTIREFRFTYEVATGGVEIEDGFE